jgi:hypothetical protein
VFFVTEELSASVSPFPIWGLQAQNIARQKNIIQNFILILYFKKIGSYHPTASQYCKLFIYFF